MLTSNGHTIARALNKTVPFDPVKDFAGISIVIIKTVGPAEFDKALGEKRNNAVETVRLTATSRRNGYQRNHA